MSTEAGEILDKSQAPMAGADMDVKPQAATPTVKEEPISPKLAVLMERERQALNRERMAKTQEERLKDKLRKIEEFEAVKTNPKKALEFLGMNYDELTQAILKDGEVPPQVEIQRLREELDQYKTQLKQEKDLEAEERKKHVLQAESKAVSDFKVEITDYLKNNAARYELIDFEGAHDLVFDVIDENYNRTVDQETGVGKVMSIAEAADKVEEHLEKKYLAAKEKNKVKAFWANMPKQLVEQVKKQEASQSPKTLTNNMGPRVSQKPNRPPEDQRVQQIVAEQLTKMRSQYAG